MNLERNVGRTDKNLRITAGIGLILIGLFFAHSFWLTLIGALVLASGVFSVCVLYQLLGMSTATAEERSSAKADLSDRATDNLDDYKEEVIETTQEVKQKAGELAEDAKEELAELKDDAEEVMQTAKKKAGELAEDAKEEIAELKDDAEEMLQTAKKKVNETIDDVKKKNT